MKKLILALVVTLGLVAVIPVTTGSSVSAAVKDDVSGTVTINGKATKGAKVFVTCKNANTGVDTIKKDTSDNSGNYFVEFKKDTCPAGSQIVVTAKKGNQGGSTVTVAEADGTTTANVAVTNVAVPEFNPIVGLTTALAVGGGLVIMRKRQLGQV